MKYTYANEIYVCMCVVACAYAVASSQLSAATHGYVRSVCGSGAHDVRKLFDILTLGGRIQASAAISCCHNMQIRVYVRACKQPAAA